MYVCVYTYQEYEDNLFSCIISSSLFWVFKIIMFICYWHGKTLCLCSLIDIILSHFPPLFCRIIEQSNNMEIASFPIYKVLFCARGHDGTTESNCFAFTESSHGSEEFQIHVFTCEIKEAVSIIYCSNLL